jgi:hypothetical protein
MPADNEYRAHTKKSLLELEAESVAFLVASAFDLDTSGYSFPYIACWRETEDAISNLKASGERSGRLPRNSWSRSSPRMGC